METLRNLESASCLVSCPIHLFGIVTAATCRQQRVQFKLPNHGIATGEQGRGNEPSDEVVLDDGDAGFGVLGVCPLYLSVWSIPIIASIVRSHSHERYVVPTHLFTVEDDS